jgi:prepilin-type N-terminal cleavage/methylation domain-containing protein
MYQLRLGRNSGFTLIELLVAVLILEVLAGIALPQLLNQAAKGRQAEAKSNLGAINRAQQAYRFENGTFGTINEGATTGTLPISVTGQYYTFTNTFTDITFASHEATAINQYDNDIKDYASALAMDEDGSFDVGICEAGAPSDPVGSMSGNGAFGVVCDEPTSILVGE